MANLVHVRSHKGAGNATMKPSSIQFSEGKLFEISLVVVLVATLFGILNVKIE